MFQKTRFVKLRSWLCVVRHQRLTLSSTVNYEMTSTKKNSELQLAFDLAGCFYHALETLWWARVPYNNQWWTRFIIRSLQSFYVHIQKWNLRLSWSSPLYGAVLRTIASHQRGPGSCQPRSQGFGFVIGSRLVPRDFFWILWFYLPLQKNSISKFQIDQDRKPTRKLAKFDVASSPQ